MKRSEKLVTQISQVIGKMENCLTPEFDMALPEKSFQETFRDDVLQVENSELNNNKEVQNLIKRIEQREKTKQTILDKINEMKVPDSVFVRHKAAIQTSLDLDLESHKSLLHQYVQAFTKNN